MSGISERSGHTAWLMARLANNRNRILGLLQRLTGLGPPVLQEPVLFAKFTHWLTEVAAARDEEMGLLTRIENIEQEHRFMRVARKLKRALPRSRAADNHCNANAKRPSRSLVWFLVLWYLFMRQKINQKKQGLTVD